MTSQAMRPRAVHRGTALKCALVEVWVVHPESFILASPDGTDRSSGSYIRRAIQSARPRWVDGTFRSLGIIHPEGYDTR